MTDEKKSFDFLFVDTESSTDDGCPTPSTIMSEDIPIRRKKESNPWKYDRKHEKPKDTKPSQDNLARHIDHHPMPHEVGIFRTREKPHRVLGLVGGKLRLLDTPNLTRGIFWLCMENGNWYGFCNMTTGTFLGHDKRGKISATKNCHGVDEYFVPMRREGGGCILHTFHPKKTELWQVAIAEDEDEGSLVEKKEGGTAWDFIKTKYVRGSVKLACPGMEEEYSLKSADCVV